MPKKPKPASKLSEESISIKDLKNRRVVSLLKEAARTPASKNEKPQPVPKKKQASKPAAAKATTKASPKKGANTFAGQPLAPMAKKLAPLKPGIKKTGSDEVPATAPVFPPESTASLNLAFATRVHRPLVKHAQEVLQSTLQGKSQAEDVLGAHFKNHPGLGKRDRAFVTDLVFAVQRHYRLLCFCAKIEEDDVEAATTLPPLCLALAQAPRWQDVFPEEELPAAEARFEEAKSDLALFFSISMELDELATAALGEDHWRRELEALDQTEQGLYLRVNRLKTTPEKVIAQFQKEEVDAVPIPGYPDALFLEKKISLQNHPLYLGGHVEVQNAGSQAIAPALDVQPGQSVWDACAGAGGKSLHLAALMQNQGRLLSSDISNKKLPELERRARRAGASILEVQKMNAVKPLGSIGMFDRILLDVPCSSLGTLRRKPGLKQTINAESLEEITALQARILTACALHLLPGGKLVYATCSILPQENQQQVDAFLEKNSGYDLLSSQTIWPSETGFDGFFWAVISRKSDA